MPFSLNPNVQVTRDRNGRIRQLSHPTQPYRPDAAALGTAAGAAAPMTPRMLADEYVRDVSQLLDLAPGATANFAAAAASSPTQAGVELRFKEEKVAGAMATIAYDQTQFGLPLWEADLSVRVNTSLMAVTGAHNATHEDVATQLPPPNAPYAPNLIDVSKLKDVLGLGANDEPRINATRLLIYRYDPAKRFDSQIQAHEMQDESIGFGEATKSFPVLPLPPVPQAIRAGQHYVVSEVLFTMAYPEWGTQNWRAFVEPETGGVLYLRALVSCARGAAFLTDPVSATGDPLSAANPVTDLDTIRTTVPLLGLDPVSANVQQLSGEFVKLENVDPPPGSMPSELSPFDFIYSCDTENFAACSAYLHCDGVFRAIQGMGIDIQQYFNNTDFPVPVDPHALNGAVNAQARGNFAGNGMGSFVFGAARAGSSVGIASDVRVVLHEFGHALLWDHVSSPNFGFAHSAGDALAAILHDPASKAPDRFETFPFMKNSTGLSRRHDRRVSDGWAWFGSRWNEQYGGEQVLSTTLFRIYQAAGGDSTRLEERKFAARYVTYLIISGVGMLTVMTTDPAVYVSTLIEADASTTNFEGFPGGAFGKVIRWSFEKQGLYQPGGTDTPLPTDPRVTTEGQPPEVDVYIDDGRSGAYLPFLPDFRGTPEVWNRHVADGGALHEVPNVGIPNCAYVAVRNRGTTPASGVRVQGFQSRAANPSVWPTDWKPLATPHIAVSSSIAPGATVVVGPFQWIPEFVGAEVLFSVSAVGDMSTLDVVNGSIANARLVSLENNIVQRPM